MSVENGENHHIVKDLVGALLGQDVDVAVRNVAGGAPEVDVDIPDAPADVDAGDDVLLVDHLVLLEKLLLGHALLDDLLEPGVLELEDVDPPAERANGDSGAEGEGEDGDGEDDDHQQVQRVSLPGDTRADLYSHHRVRLLG